MILRESIKDTVYTDYRTAWSKGEYPNGIEVSSGVIADKIIAQIKDWILQHTSGKCHDPVCEPEQLVTHDMAIDAEDPELEGTIFRDAEYHRCGVCLNCIKDQILEQLTKEFDNE